MNNIIHQDVVPVKRCKVTVVPFRYLFRPFWDNWIQGVPRELLGVLGPQFSF